MPGRSEPAAPPVLKFFLWCVPPRWEYQYSHGFTRLRNRLARILKKNCLASGGKINRLKWYADNAPYGGFQPKSFYPACFRPGTTCPSIPGISDDKSLVQTIAAVVEAVEGRLNCASAATAREFIARQRVDGIVVDLKLAGALEMMKKVRASSANRSAVVFACLSSEPETQLAIHAGANFVL